MVWFPCSQYERVYGPDNEKDILKSRARSAYLHHLGVEIKNARRSHGLHPSILISSLFLYNNNAHWRTPAMTFSEGHMSLGQERCVIHA